MTPPASRPTGFGRIHPPDEAWLAGHPPEAILEPDLPIIDTHHHLWDRGGHRYFLHDYLAEADPEVQGVEWLAGERTLAQILQEQGYVTGLSGKWHLGRPERRPSGFDYWFSHSIPVSRPSAFESPWPPPADPPGRAYNRHTITDHGVDFLRRRPGTFGAAP